MPGKKFEQDIVESIKDTGQLTYDRLYDPSFGFSGVSNICDYILYSFPILIYVEAKSVKYGVFDIGNIPEGKYRNITRIQYEGLLEKSYHKGIHAGIILEYRLEGIQEERQHYYIPIQEVKSMVKAGKKSINIKDIKDINAIQLQSTKRITRYRINFAELLKELKGELL